MKKLFLFLGILLGLSTFTMAQTGPKKDAKKMTADTAKKATSSKMATTSKSATTSKPATTAGPAKKDGTPDMRYKKNKDAAKMKTDTAVHKKKDGTPDKRYKENKPKKG